MSEMSVRKMSARIAEQNLRAIVARRVRSPAAAELAAGSTQGISGSQAGAGAGGSTPRRNDAAALNEVMLPWPPKELSPNARVHWAAKNRAVKLYRDNCAWLTKVAGLRVDWAGTVHAWITFYPPDRRHRDDDNLIAAFKSGRDGMADALIVDDKRFRIHPLLSDEVVKGGAVKVRLSMGPEE